MPLKTASPQLNTHGPRAGRVRMLLGFTEGSGTTATNLAHSRDKLNGLTNFTISGGAWSTNSDGPVYDTGASGGSGTIISPTASADTIFANGTIAIYFKGSADTGARPLLTAGSAPLTTHGGLVCLRPSGTTTCRVQIRNQAGTTTHGLDATYSNYEGWNLLVISWGSKGFRAWLNGTAATTQTGSPDTYYGFVRVPSGDRFRICKNETAGTFGNCAVAMFCMWDTELSARDRDWLLADPYCMLREPAGKAAEIAAATAWTANTTYNTHDIRKPTVDNGYYYMALAAAGGGPGDSVEPTWPTIPNTTVVDNEVVWTCVTPSPFVFPNVMPMGRATETTIDPWATLARWRTSSTAYVRFRSATTVAGLSAATPVVASTANSRNQLVPQLTALTADTRRYGLAEWSADGSTYYPFQNGFYTLVPKRTVASSTYNVVSLGDSHISQPNTGGVVLPDTMTDVVDHAYLTDGSFNTTHGSRDRMAVAKTMLALSDRWATYDFVMFMGDHPMPDGDDSATDEDGDPSYFMYLCWRSFAAQFAAAIISGCSYFILGNHEAERGDMQNRYGAQQKRAQNCRLECWRNPDNDTYPEGGEDGQDTGWVASANEGTNVVSTGTPLENFFAFTWGGWLHAITDTSRYSRIGMTYSATGTNVYEYRAGHAQRSFIERMCALNGRLGKVMWKHSRFGGNYIGTISGTGAYGRGSSESVGLYPLSDEYWMFEKFYECGWTADLNGHDHKVIHGNFRQIPTFCVGNTGTPSHFTATTNRGWPFDEMCADYGSPQSLGLTNNSSQRLGTTVYGNNCCGFVLLEFSSTGFYVNHIQTAVATSASGDAENTVLKYLLQWNGTAGQSWIERFLSNQSHTPSASKRVTLSTGDSLNSSPEPRHVYGIYDTPAGTWWTGALTQRYAGYQPATIDSGGGVTYVAGDCVIPTIPNGFLYRCTASTGACNAEPTTNGTGATDWPLAIAGTITVGNTTWEAAGRHSRYPFDEAHGSHLIQGTQAIGASASPVYVPRVLYRAFVPVRSRPVPGVKVVSSMPLAAMASPNFLPMDSALFAIQATIFFGVAT